MTNRLNTSQVEALQEALTAGNMPSRGTGVICRERNGSRCPPIMEYDFRQPKRISKDQICSLMTLHEGFARTVASQWTGLLGTTVEVDIIGVEQRTYAEYAATLANPTCFGLARAGTLDGTVCLELSPDVFYSIVNQLMGGGGATSCIPDRPLTLIEQRLARSLLHHMMSLLSEAWTTVHPVHFVLEEIESNPMISQVVPPNEEVVAFEFNVRSSGFSGTVTLCVPFVVIEPVVDELGRRSGACVSGGDAGPSVATGHPGLMTQHIGKAGLAVTATLAETTMTLSELQSLSVGDLILTERASDALAVLAIEGQPKYRVMPGMHRGTRVVRVIEPAEPGDQG